jgi:histidyl-tRNA synthetase
LKGSVPEKLIKLRTVLQDSSIGIKGIEEIKEVFDKIHMLGLETSTLDFDITLARGLNYYTGSIFEIEAKGVSIGSIGGGGRYDDLTGIFGLNDMPGIGISFGLDRIYLVLEELGLFPDFQENLCQVLFVNFGASEADFCLKALTKIRRAGINAELYPDAAKMKKQMNYAHKKNISYVVLVGEDELAQDLLTVKNMKDGNQSRHSVTELIDLIRK